MNQLKKCMEFLKANGFEQLIEVVDYPRAEDEYYSFLKPDCIQLDVAKDGSEIVFIDESGDYLTIDCSYYALIGALLEQRIIGCNYVPIKEN